MGTVIDIRNRKTTKLDLLEVDWIEVYDTLTAGEARRQRGAGISYRMEQSVKSGEKSKDDQKVKVGLDLAAMDFEKVLVRVMSWSLETGSGHLQINRENLEILPEELFDAIVKAIDDFTTAQEKEKNSQSPGEPERHARLVGAGSTVPTS